MAALLAGFGCQSQPPIPALPYTCAVNADPSTPSLAGAPDDCSDIALPPEPTLPMPPTDPACTLTAQIGTTDDNWIPDETNIDTMRIQTALNTCPVVRLVTDGGANNAFVSGPLTMNGVTLWIDQGVTLYESRDPNNYQANKTATSPGDCGKVGINDSSACTSFLTVMGTSPAIVGDGIIDGQGGERLIGHDYSWWQLSSALQTIDGSIGNPTMIDLKTGVTSFVMYRITLHNSAKFHVKITSTPPGGMAAGCPSPGAGFIVWGVTILTPSRWLNHDGLLMSPHFSRNTDGIDPGETSFATCGAMVNNTISTGDDHIAIKGGHGVSDIRVVHNHFGSGHGMSIGSETYGGVDGLTVCDLTIDADSRPVGEGASPGDMNGIRVKSDSSRGGPVTNVQFRNVCMRDVNNAILMSTAYNPLFSGMKIPQFSNITFQNIHDVNCINTVQPVVTLNGFSALYPATNIGLDNVVVDWTGPLAVSTEFAQLDLGPGPVNFAPYLAGQDVSVSPPNFQSPSSPAPINCTFPVLPAPVVPPGWKN